MTLTDCDEPKSNPNQHTPPKVATPSRSKKTCTSLFVQRRLPSRSASHCRKMDATSPVGDQN